MGGKNHQPCGSFLLESTRLSRSLSLAYAELELGNVALEDVILAELEGGIGFLSNIVVHLDLSRKYLDDAIKNLDSIRQKMRNKNFIDLPTLRKVDLSATGAIFIMKDLVTSDSWIKVAETMKKEGFYEILFSFETTIEELKTKTSVLSEQILNLSDSATEGEIHKVLEENRSGNIKVAFATLYNCWTRFNHDFLASSLLSTELWYVFQGFDSLVGRESKSTVAVAIA